MAGALASFKAGGLVKRVAGEAVEAAVKRRAKRAASHEVKVPERKGPRALEQPTEEMTPEELLRYPARTVERATGVKATVEDPKRVLFPSVYRDPKAIASEALEFVGPESSALQELFGVTRTDLASMAERPGTIEDPFKLIAGYAKKPKGAAHAAGVMTPANEQRLLDVMSEVEGTPLWTGMKGWYPLDPAYQRIVQLVGGDEREALRIFNQLNAFSGIESPNLAVPFELQRASAAHAMAERGQFEDWVRYGGLRGGERGADFPEFLRGVPGRVGHKRASATQRQVMETGEHGMASPKAPLYIAASGVPESGFQTSLPVMDAHFARALGLPDVRTAGQATGLVESATTPELTTLGPWWRERIAGPSGLEAVPAQAVMWGALAPQTGVKTQIGAPKLEILADLIKRRAAELGKDPAEVRDLILLGKERLKRGGQVGGALERYAEGGEVGGLVDPEASIGPIPRGALAQAVGRAGEGLEWLGGLPRRGVEAMAPGGGGARGEAIAALPELLGIPSAGRALQDWSYGFGPFRVGETGQGPMGAVYGMDVDPRILDVAGVAPMARMPKAIARPVSRAITPALERAARAVVPPEMLPGGLPGVSRVLSRSGEQPPSLDRNVTRSVDDKGWEWTVTEMLDAPSGLKSPFSPDALKWADDMAKRLGKPVQIVHEEKPGGGFLIRGKVTHGEGIETEKAAAEAKTKGYARGGSVIAYPMKSGGAPAKSKAKSKVAAAFTELARKEPAIIGHTREKFGAERAEKQRVAIALNKARQAGAKIPKYADGGAVDYQRGGWTPEMLRGMLGTRGIGPAVRDRMRPPMGGALSAMSPEMMAMPRGPMPVMEPRRMAAAPMRFQDGGPVEFSAGRADFIPAWRDPSVGFTPKDLLFAAPTLFSPMGGLKQVAAAAARQRALREAARWAADPVERLFAEAARKIPSMGMAQGGGVLGPVGMMNYAGAPLATTNWGQDVIGRVRAGQFANGGGVMNSTAFPTVTAPRGLQTPELMAMASRLRARPPVQRMAEGGAVEDVAKVLDMIIKEEAATT